ncbi:MAG: hypothetical protein FD189_2398 [Elusimicrobia bacterium]|nr:MAG: hypothetical protein FD154_2386 [Elusimicrobiota bacterium]KAF0153361.1 MAG: hypothetical protein FD189_2398 [Elusimicrobiota bacterium]
MTIKKTASTLITAAAFFSFSAAAFAQVPAGYAEFSESERKAAQRNPDYYTINPASVRLVRIAEGEDPDLLEKQRKAAQSGAGESLVLIEKIINIAEKIWAIIERNAPVVNITTQYATAVPDGIKSWTHLQNWSRPRTYTYGFYADNLYGVTVLDVKYKVAYSYGGNYKGKGKYLTGVTVIPEKVDLAWGYKFSMTAQVPDSTVVNIGTHADPHAALQLKLNWRISTPIKSSDGTSVYYIQGNGGFAEIASPWKAADASFDDMDVTGYQAAAPLAPGSKIFE